MEQKFLKFEGMDYMVGFPEGYEAGEKRPVLFLFHGAGTRGEDIKILQESNDTYFEYIKGLDEYPFILVTPLCTENTWFDMFERLERFVLFIANEAFADKNRIYAMGVSMGGYALWQLGMSIPEVFAAIAPLCGGGMYWNAERLKNVPIWAFHGAKDEVVLPEESKKMVNRVNETGGSARLTICPEIAHNVWDVAYPNAELYKWFLTNENKNDKETVDRYRDSKIYG